MKFNNFIRFFFFVDEELQNQNTEELKYEIPKPINELEISYVTMKDFTFDSEQVV